MRKPNGLRVVLALVLFISINIQGIAQDVQTGENLMVSKSKKDSVMERLGLKKDLS
jgi:hypothetical protein